MAFHGSLHRHLDASCLHAFVLCSYTIRTISMISVHCLCSFHYCRTLSVQCSLFLYTFHTVSTIPIHFLYNVCTLPVNAPSIFRAFFVWCLQQQKQRVGFYLLLIQTPTTNLHFSEKSWPKDLSPGGKHVGV